MYKFERYRQIGLADFNQPVELKMKPYYQYVVGLLGFTNKASFVPSLLVEFRKHLDENSLNKMKEMIITYNIPDVPGPGIDDFIVQKLHLELSVT